ncbi:MAG: protein kinase [Planctomycetota bacterium]
MPDIDPLKIGKPLGNDHPRELGRYDLLRVLGQGGMGTVFLAKQKNLGRLVALKLLGGARKVRDDWKARFELEIDALARLHHPNIVAILDRGEDDGRMFYVMEFIDGVPLRRFIKKPQKFQAITRIAYKVCLALEKVHDEGLVHRDMKPDNILIDKYGEVKLTDFGIVKSVQRPGDGGAGDGPVLTGQGATIGTAAYMAPEQMFGRGEIGPPADVYAMGVMFHELIVGLRPEPDMPKVTAIVPGLPVWVDEFLNFCLHIDPKRRFANGNELKKFLTIHANKVKGNFPMVGTVPLMLGGKGASGKPGSAPMKLPSGRTKHAGKPGAPAGGGSSLALGDPWEADDNGDGAGDLATALKGGESRVVSAEAVASATSPVGKAKDKRAATQRAKQKMAQARAAVRAVGDREDDDEDDSLLVLDDTAPPAAVPLVPPVAAMEWSVRNCPRCKGTGAARKMLLFKRPCKLCESQGRVYRARRDVKRLRRAYWMMMMLALGVSGGAGYLAFTRVTAKDGVIPPLDFFGTQPLPCIVMAIAAATLLIVLWALDVAAQQNWQPTDLLPNGSVVWPGRRSVRRLLIGTTVCLLLIVGSGVVLPMVLKPGAPVNPHPTPTADDKTPPFSFEQLTAMGFEPPRPWPDADTPEQQRLLAWQDLKPNRNRYTELVRSRDLARMVYIPADTDSSGPTQFGTPGETDDFDVPTPANETPAVSIRMPGYFIDVNEITSQQFAEFLTVNSLKLNTGKVDNRIDVVHLKAPPYSVLAYDVEDVIAQAGKYLKDVHGNPVDPSMLPTIRGGLTCGAGGSWVLRTFPNQTEADEKMPMIFVTSFGARAYAEWVGGRLPTELEWEKAAVGQMTSKFVPFRYPWGVAFHGRTGARNLSNTASQFLPTPATQLELAELVAKDPQLRKQLMAQPINWNGNSDYSPYRVSMMAGNVAEWCHNVYRPELYKDLARSPETLGAFMVPPNPGEPAAFRGAGFDESREPVRSRYRRSAPQDHATWNLGFRVVVPAPATTSAVSPSGGE